MKAEVNLLGAHYECDDKGNVSMVININDDNKIRTIFRYNFNDSYGYEEVFEKIGLEKLKEVLEYAKNDPVALDIFDVYLTLYRGNLEEVKAKAIHNKAYACYKRYLNHSKFINRLFKKKGNDRNPIKKVIISRDMVKINDLESSCKERILILREGFDRFETIYDYTEGQQIGANEQLVPYEIIDEYVEISCQDLMDIIVLLETDTQIAVFMNYLVNFTKVYLDNTDNNYSFVKKAKLGVE